jgi:hypothetical protein
MAAEHGREQHIIARMATVRATEEEEEDRSIGSSF